MPATLRTASHHEDGSRRGCGRGDEPVRPWGRRSPDAAGRAQRAAAALLFELEVVEDVDFSEDPPEAPEDGPDDFSDPFSDPLSDDFSDDFSEDFSDEESDAFPYSPLAAARESLR
ncbi:MAG TPA: hypothetical protein VNC14_05370 [Lapillicoccus sp.]|nr:hypothetical protein [Lapillicoccus sp.]